MDFKEEDFPLYQQLVKLDELGVEAAKADFKKAVEGDETAAMMVQSFKERGLGKAPKQPPSPKR